MAIARLLYRNEHGLLTVGKEKTIRTEEMRFIRSTRQNSEELTVKVIDWYKYKIHMNKLKITGKNGQIVWKEWSQLVFLIRRCV